MEAGWGSREGHDAVLGPGIRGIGPFEELTVFTDGAARGNPGPASIGVVVKDERGRTVASFGEYIGNATNNLAEYTALVHALRLLSAFQVERLRLRVDSELLARQLRGEYKVREAHLRTLHAQALSMLRRFREWSVEEVPREMNREADALANRALDAALKGGGPDSRGAATPSGSSQGERQGELFG